MFLLATHSYCEAKGLMS